MLTLREKSRSLEGKLRELVQFGEENDSISERVHRITLTLLAARDLPFLIEALYKNLREDFAVPAVALRLWMETSARDRIEFTDIGQEARVFAESITDPYFSEHPILDTGSLVWKRPAQKFVRWSTSRCGSSARLDCSCWAARTRSGSLPTWARCT